MLHLSGHRYCDRIITMGTPFRGTKLVWLALFSPFGFFWPDMWQMRPGAKFLKQLRTVPVPDHVNIYCLFSDRDDVSKGKHGIFEPAPTSDQVTPVSAHHISHYEFLYRREIGDTITYLLDKEIPAKPTSDTDKLVVEKPVRKSTTA
jgi:hypothetical protein